jgi:DNA-binding HxlR family transcriptional regulator
MNDRLVKTITKILCLDFDNNSSVNAIIKQTGISDRTHVFEAIKALHKGGLITEIKSSQHKQKKIKKLTPLGNEIAELVDSIIKFRESYQALPKFDKQKLPDTTFISNPIPEGATNIHRKTIKIDHKEISQFVTSDYIISYDVQKKINEVLLIRHASISAKYQLNKVAKSILDEIIIDSIIQNLSYMLEDTVKVDPDVFSLIDDFEIVNRVEKILLFAKRSFNLDEVQKVVESILSVLKLSKHDILKHQKLLNDAAQLFQQKNLPDDLEYVHNLIPIYKHLLNKST